jgi:hypothetical protein
LSLSPATIWNTFTYYVSYLLNPALVVLVIAALVLVAPDRRRFMIGLALSVAGLAAFAPHSLLPNHLFEEYAWAAASLFLAPVLVLGETVRSLNRKSLRIALTGLLALLSIAGLGSYQDVYQTPAERWFVHEDRKGAKLRAGLPAFHSLARPAKILVVGLDDPIVPWQSEGFVRFEFGDGLLWTVVLPRSAEFRQNSKLVKFDDVTNIQLSKFDFVATYQPNGTLVSIRSIGTLPKSQAQSEVLVPALSIPLAESRAHPSDYAPFLQASAIAVDWGLWTDAARLLEEAHRNGAADSNYQRIVAELHDGLAATAKASQLPELTASPAHIIQPDGSGLGETELFWKVPAGVAFEIHVDKPNGPIFSAGDKSGHARTAKWVSNGMQFFLQDVSGGNALTEEHTLAHVQVFVSRE